MFDPAVLIACSSLVLYIVIDNFRCDTAETI